MRSPILLERLLIEIGVMAMPKKAVSTETPEPVQIKPPDQLSPEAREIWDRKIQQMAAWDLIEKIDFGILALYCDSVAKYAEVSRKRSRSLREQRILLRYSQLILKYSDKLGFNPWARAKLMARRRGVSGETIKRTCPD